MPFASINPTYSQNSIISFEYVWSVKLFKTRVFWLLLYLMQIAGNGFECGSWNTNTAALLENCQKKPLPRPKPSF